MIVGNSISSIENCIEQFVVQHKLIKTFKYSDYLYSVDNNISQAGKEKLIGYIKVIDFGDQIFFVKSLSLR